MLKRFSFSLFVILPLLAGCSAEKTEIKTEPIANTDSLKPAPKDSLLIELTGRDSVSVLDLLEETHEVDKFSTAQGSFVKAIDSIENGSTVFWLYSVNGKMGEIASDRFLTGTGDTVRWHFRLFEDK